MDLTEVGVGAGVALAMQVAAGWVAVGLAAVIVGVDGWLALTIALG